ncbi:MAG: putative transposase, partial [Planctomycetota bacterium]
MNRGIARRSMFESRDDIRYFMACLARGVRRGQIEIHAWCVMTTHYHLLVYSPRGELSVAMGRAQNDY